MEYNGEDSYFQDSNIVWIKHSDELDNQFLKQIYSIVKWSSLEGATIQRLYNSNILETEVNIPSLHEQRTLASFFTSLDAQISASTSRLDSLKQVKAASLQAMFPQEGKTVPKVRFKGFLGEWKKVKLGEFVNISRGLTYTPSNISDKGVRVLRSSNIDEGCFVLSETDVFVQHSCVNIEFVHEGDILITAANGSPRLVGKHAIVQSTNTPCVAGGFMLLATGIENVFVNALMGADWYPKFLKVGVSGGNGAIGNLNKNDLENADVLIPTEKRERDRIATFFTSLDRQIALQSQRLEKLKQIKAACLDKMFV